MFFELKLTKKRFFGGHLVDTSCGYIRIFSGFSVRSNANSGFSKIPGCALEGCTLLKCCFTLIFGKIFF